MMNRLLFAAALAAIILGSQASIAEAQTTTPASIDFSVDTGAHTTRQDRANRFYIAATTLTLVGGGVLAGALAHAALREPPVCTMPSCDGAYTATIGALVVGGGIVALHGLALFIPAIVLDLDDDDSVSLGLRAGADGGGLELSGRF